MTYNMLAFTPDVSPVADVIREENADIIFMQETSFAMVDHLQKEMLDEYPYQFHLPSDIPLGMSIVSKYPFEPIDHDLGGGWVGTPIPLAVNWSGRRIHVLNFHMFPTGFGSILHLDVVDEISQARNRNADNINRFVDEYDVPAIVAGDANDVSLNDAHRSLVNAGLQDVWTTAGFGLGHTFPGNESPGTSRPYVCGFYVPEWLIRIDYIFASPEWEVLSAHIARTDGYSDHRGVVAFLRLK
jgi:endonuclease/exonuclease/phosphatase family metal-dependent hydrolase